ncbi:MAG: hypothetical protein NVS1B12_11630 [Acidimicrobiales bacterium]
MTTSPARGAVRLRLMPWRRASVGRRQRGSALLLFPAAVMVVFALGVICVDSGSAYLARRALTDHATAAADDVAAQAVDLAAFYGNPAVLRIDPVRAERVLEDLTSAQRTDGGVMITGERLAISPDGRQVTVTAVGRARTVFAFGPARRRFVILTARATATVRQVAIRPA